ncbi:hypothetical protein QJQ45_026008 [Haematococcus lacustris]|nr:hypothetical protein QJQ45_026008 [Haematococcus lacustris]
MATCTPQHGYSAWMMFAKPLRFPRKGNASAPSPPHRVQPVPVAVGSKMSVTRDTRELLVSVARSFKAALRALVEAARLDLSPAQVDAVVAEIHFSHRTAAAPVKLPSPAQLDILDPKLLAQIRDAMGVLTTASVLEHVMRGPHHRGIKLLPDSWMRSTCTWDALWEEHQAMVAPAAVGDALAQERVIESFCKKV